MRFTLPKPAGRREYIHILHDGYVDEIYRYSSMLKQTDETRVHGALTVSRLEEPYVKMRQQQNTNVKGRAMERGRCPVWKEIVLRGRS